jgi:hypothetical protein
MKQTTIIMRKSVDIPTSSIVVSHGPTSQSLLHSRSLLYSPATCLPGEKWSPRWGLGLPIVHLSCRNEYGGLVPWCLAEKNSNYSPAGSMKGFFSLLATASRQTLGSTQPPSKWLSGAKRPRREASAFTSSSAEVTNAWKYNVTHSYFVMA